ncbi:MAG: thioredoxin domain-containing protein [Oscillospiraceae bacterium]|nr:thioredoxin domain-containing protein [Oscillospiraceae bacterium]
MNKTKALRIAALAVVLALIAGIWVFKDYQERGNSKSAPAESGLPTLTAEEEADFALDAESLDMDKLTSYGLPIIIDFGADWCGPCRQFAPIYEAMHDEMLGKAIIKYVDFDKYSDIAGAYPVSVIPTQVFINPDGTPYEPSEGLGMDFKTYADKESGKVMFTTHEGSMTEEQLRTVLEDMGAGQ